LPCASAGILTALKNASLFREGGGCLGSSGFPRAKPNVFGNVYPVRGGAWHNWTRTEKKPAHAGKVGACTILPCASSGDPCGFKKCLSLSRGGRLIGFPQDFTASRVEHCCRGLSPHFVCPGNWAFFGVSGRFDKIKPDRTATKAGGGLGRGHKRLLRLPLWSLFPRARVPASPLTQVQTREWLVSFSFEGLLRLYAGACCFCAR